MKTLMLFIVSMAIITNTKSQSISTVKKTNESALLHEGFANSLSSPLTSPCSSELQKSFSNQAAATLMSATYRSTNWRSVRRTGCFVMLTGAGLIALGSLALEASPSNNNWGGSLGDVVGVVAVGGGALAVVSGAIVTIVGATGAATNRKYSIQLQPKNNGLSLVYPF